MNKDKIIKDLKERNDKIANQYRLRDIRCVHLEIENKELKEKQNYDLKWALKYDELYQENQQLKEKNERFKCLLESQAYKDLNKKAQQKDLYKSVIDEIKGIVEETNYLANKTEIVNRGNIELHGVIDRLCLILRKIETLDKPKGDK